jgi:hypothetical protein
VVGLGLAIDLDAPATWRDELGALAEAADREAHLRFRGPWELQDFARSGRFDVEKIDVGRISGASLAARWERFPDATDDLALVLDRFGELRLTTTASPSTPEYGLVDCWRHSDERSADGLALARLEHLRAAARHEALMTGFVHVDSTHAPYREAVTNVSSSNFDPRIHAPGYYWAVVLSAAHLDRLGGIDVVIALAPVWSVEPVERAGPAVLCILTEVPSQVDADTFQRWRTFLRPTLPAGLPWSLTDIGERGSAWERPVWIFEGDPIPFGAGVRMGSNTPLPRRRGPQPEERIAWPVAPPDDPRDPEMLRCRMLLGPRFDGDVHSRSVVRVVEAWADLAMRGHLRDVAAPIRRVDQAPAIRPTATGSALEWAFSPGAADVVRALANLVDALDALDEHFGGGVIGDVVDAAIA